MPNSTTSTLLRHARSKHIDVIGKDQRWTKSVTTSSTRRLFTKKRYQYALVKWVTGNSRPVSIVDDDGLKSAFLLCNQFSVLPSVATLKKNIQFTYDEARECIKKLLHSTPGKFCLSIKSWIANDFTTYLGIYLHYYNEHKQERESFLLDLIPLKDNSSHGMAVEFIESIKAFGISDRIFCITTDCGTLSSNFVNQVDLWYTTNHIPYKLSNTWILSIEDAITHAVRSFFSQFQNELESIRRSIRFIKSSGLRSSRLDEIINRDFPDLLKHTKLYLDNNKQWTSTCEMLDNYCFLENAIAAFYNNIEDSSFCDSENEFYINSILGNNNGIIPNSSNPTSQGSTAASSSATSPISITRETIIPSQETMIRIKEMNQFLSTIYSAYTFVNRSNVLLSSSLVVYDTVIETCEQQYTTNKFPNIQNEINEFYNKLIDYSQHNNFAATASLIFDPRFKDGYLVEHHWNINEKNNNDSINNYLHDVYETEPPVENQSNPSQTPSMPVAKKMKLDKKTNEQFESYSHEPREQNSELFNLIFYWNSHDFGTVNKFAKDLIVIPPSSKELSDCFNTLDTFLSEPSSATMNGDEIRKHQSLHHWINGPLNDFSPSKMIYSEDNMNCVNDNTRLSVDELKLENVPVPI